MNAVIWCREWEGNLNFDFQRLHITKPQDFLSYLSSVSFRIFRFAPVQKIQQGRFSRFFHLSRADRTVHFSQKWWWPILLGSFSPLFSQNYRYWIAWITKVSSPDTPEMWFHTERNRISPHRWESLRGPSPLRFGRLFRIYFSFLYISRADSLIFTVFRASAIWEITEFYAVGSPSHKLLKCFYGCEKCMGIQRKTSNFDIQTISSSVTPTEMSRNVCIHWRRDDISSNHGDRIVPWPPLLQAPWIF